MLIFHCWPSIIMEFYLIVFCCCCLICFDFPCNFAHEIHIDTCILHIDVRGNSCQMNSFNGEMTFSPLNWLTLQTNGFYIWQMKNNNNTPFLYETLGRTNNTNSFGLYFFFPFNNQIGLKALNNEHTNISLHSCTHIYIYIYN